MKNVSTQERKVFAPSEEAMIEKARVFSRAAYAAHGVVRKYDGSEYIVHPHAVAERVRRMPGATWEMVAAAYLHDVVEDTLVALSIIREEFGDEVARLTDGLTDVSKPEDGNRRERKELDRLHTIAQCWKVKSVKNADVTDNFPSIVAKDFGFAKKWVREKAELYDGGNMLDSDPESHAEVMALIAAFYADPRHRHG
jgi:(p)ppGpp synthase/HD superfamily hydrolase